MYLPSVPAWHVTKQLFFTFSVILHSHTLHSYQFFLHSSFRPGQITIKTMSNFNPLNAELNPICHLLALLGAHHFLHVSRIGVK